MTKHNLKAIIYDRKGRVLSIGQNSYIKTHPYQASLAKSVSLPEKIYLHAEINAIIKCPDLSRAYRIFISRFDQAGTARLAKPCPVCDEAIRLAGIKCVEYTG